MRAKGANGDSGIVPEAGRGSLCGSVCVTQIIFYSLDRRYSSVAVFYSSSQGRFKSLLTCISHLNLQMKSCLS